MIREWLEEKLGVRVRWQNLNEDQDGHPKGPPWHGRAWLSLRRGGRSVQFCWNLWSPFTQASVSVDPGEREVTVALAARLAAWVTIPVPDAVPLRAVGAEEHTVGVSLCEDGSVWWDVWHPRWSWTAGTPRWRHGSFDVVDALLGPPRVTDRTIAAERPVQVPLPEGDYHGTAKVEEMVVRRRRWFTRSYRTVTVDVPGGVPVPGKGENSWDCGDDAVYARTTRGASVQDAVVDFAADVLKTRARHGAPMRWPKAPAPSSGTSTPSSLTPPTQAEYDALPVPNLRSPMCGVQVGVGGGGPPGSMSYHMRSCGQTLPCPSHPDAPAQAAPDIAAAVKDHLASGATGGGTGVGETAGGGDLFVGQRVYYRRGDLYGTVTAVEGDVAQVKMEWPWDQDLPPRHLPVCLLVDSSEVAHVG